MAQGQIEEKTLPLPLLPLQILFLNLVTDVFPAFALAMGNLGAYPPMLAAWSPFFLFLLIGDNLYHDVIVDKFGATSGSDLDSVMLGTEEGITGALIVSDDATVDPELIRRFWPRGSRANIGIHLEKSGLVDVAPDSGDEPRMPWEAPVYQSSGVLLESEYEGNRHLAELLTERGVDFDRVEYHVEGLPESARFVIDARRSGGGAGGGGAANWLGGTIIQWDGGA